MTQTPKWLLKALEERDGHVSAWSGYDVPELVPQHRQGGMGGGRRKQRLSNVVWLESVLNGLIESDPWYQAEASRRGIKISQHSDPECVPVQHAVHGLVLLRDDGGMDVFTDPEREEYEALRGGGKNRMVQS